MFKTDRTTAHLGEREQDWYIKNSKYVNVTLYLGGFDVDWIFF